MELAAQERRMLLNLAISVARCSLAGLPPPQLPPETAGLYQPAGCFVSLHVRQTHQLRGCMGRLDATQPLAPVVAHTVLTTLRDPRFAERPVKLEELPMLELEISILSPLLPVPSPMEFDLQNDGIYLTASGRSGCFLPQVARETGWSKEQLLQRLCAEKMGLPADAWKQPEARMQVFSVMLLGPAGF